MAIATSNAHPPGLFAQGIANAVGSQSESEGAVRHALLQMMMCDERAFCRAAGTLLLTPDLPGSRQLVQFLLRQKLFVEALASADRYESAQAVAVVRSAAKIGPLLGDELEQALASALHKAPAAANVARIMRILELIAAVSASSRFLAFQHELMAYPDPKVRSKAALLAGRSAKSIASVGRLLRDEDARVQANVDNPPTEVQAKGHHGFSSSPEQLAKVVSSGVSLAKGPSVLEGIEKAAQAISHLSGARHLFVFFHSASVDELVTEQRRVEQLAALLRDERIVLHGFAPSSSGDDRHFHELCGAMQGGNFEVCPVNAIPETLDRIFSQLLNRYEITYRLPQGDQPPNEGKLVLSSPQGCGHAPYLLTPSAATSP